MKKLSLYVFLVLMLASCSEYQKKKAIENCADVEFHIFTGDSPGVWSAFIEKSTRELKKYEKQYNLKHSEWYKIKAVVETMQTKYSMERKYNIQGYKWVVRKQSDMSDEEFAEQEVTINDKFNQKFEKKRIIEKEMADIRELINLTKIELGRKDFKKASLERKFLNYLYVNGFSECEKKYIESPISFKQRFGN